MLSEYLSQTKFTTKGPLTSGKIHLYDFWSLKECNVK